MRYYRLPGRKHSSGSDSLVVVDDGDAYDLSTASDDLGSFTQLARAANACDESVDAIARNRIPDADPVELDPDDVLLPVTPDEVWAAGVTYQISEQAREEESSMPDMYFDVYDADRPEIFFKATPSRIVEPGDAIGVRDDSEWDVPEPELGIVLRRGEIVGYTVGNDVSSRSIEGENPLYLPQAKVYDRCCSIGPSVVTPEDIDDPHELEMRMTIEREGEVIYDDATNTSEMVRSCDELVSYFTRHNTVPELAVILTGTSIVPDHPFDLQEGDRVDITVEGIGTLSNSVTTV